MIDLKGKENHPLTVFLLETNIKIAWSSIVSAHKQGMKSSNLKAVKQYCQDLDVMFSELRKDFSIAFFLDERNEKEARGYMYAAEDMLYSLHEHFRELTNNC